MGNGKSVRLRRLLHNGESLVAVPLDHAMAHGVVGPLCDAESLIPLIVAGLPDAITLHKGLARRYFARYAGDTHLVLKCTTFTPLDPTYDVQVATVEEAVILGADGVAAGLIIGDARQAELIAQFARIAREADRWQMPMIGHIYPRGDRIDPAERSSVQQVTYCARLGAELGADIVEDDVHGVGGFVR